MKFDIDWIELDSAVNPAPVAELDFVRVASQFRKVAFDVYEKIGETGLWELREKEDGTKVLVALYEEDMPKTATASASAWTATANRAGDAVTLQYNGVPVVKMASAQYGFTSEEAGQFASFIAAKATNGGKEFVERLAGSLSAAARAHLLNTVAVKGE
jgi:hypothetical protein